MESESGTEGEAQRGIEVLDFLTDFNPYEFVTPVAANVA